MDKFNVCAHIEYVIPVYYQTVAVQKYYQYWVSSHILNTLKKIKHQISQ